MAGQKRIPILMFLMGTFVTQAGCVALNIPSRRYHDPNDHGGLLGHWRMGEPASAQHLAGRGGEFHDAGPPRICAGPVGVDPCDPLLDMEDQAKPPEVPWPRFHPVPTRSVFGASSH